jgi:ribosomal protein L7/L12
MDDPTLMTRFAAIEAQLRVISDHLGIACPPFASDVVTAGASGLPTEVLELAQAGHTTQATARLRELTGASLLEAKRAIDAL